MPYTTPPKGRVQGVRVGVHVTLVPASDVLRVRVLSRLGPDVLAGSSVAATDM